MRSFSNIPGALVVWIASYVFFLFTLANNFSASHDSIHYLLDILNGNELFHQHHLLYNFLASKWRLLLPGLPPQYAIESFTAFWGSSAMAVIYSFFRNRFFLAPFAAAAGTAIIAFSYGVWFYSVNIEVYMPPLFFIVCCLYFITKKEMDISDVRKIALLHCLAILFHQVNILFAVVVIWAIIINRKNVKVFSALAQYCLIGIIVAGGMYFLAGWFFEGHSSVAQWMRWVEGYTVGHGYWQPLSINTPVRVFTGFSHAFIGGHFVFQIPAVEHALQHSFRDHGLTDEIFLASKISSAAVWALCILTVFFVTIFISSVARLFKNYKAVIRHSANIVAPMMLTIVVYSVFFCFWMPEILEFWILQMVLVWMLLIGTAPLIRLPFNVPLRAGLVAVALTVFSINFFGSLRWLQDINNDWYYRETCKIRNDVGANDLVVVDNEWILKDFIRYYTQARVLATDEPGYSRTKEDVLIKQFLFKKGRVYIYRDHHFTRSY